MANTSGASFRIQKSIQSSNENWAKRKVRKKSKKGSFKRKGYEYCSIEELKNILY